MKILSVTDPSFKEYGSIIDIDSTEIVSYLKEKAKMPQKNTNLYQRDDMDMHSLKGIKEIKEKVYGFGDIEVGYCNGYNSLLNCMEYHACPEVDIAANDLVLLLARKEDIHDGILESKDVKAFLLKENQAVILNPYTLHFSPCKLSEDGFRCAIILSNKTNMDLDETPSDKTLWKVNKWLLAHKDTIQAKNGAYVGIVGENLKVDF